MAATRMQFTIQRGRRTLFKHTHKYDTVTSARKEKQWVQTRAWNTAGSVTWIQEWDSENGFGKNKLKSLKANIERRNVLERRNTCAKASVSGGSRISKKTKTGGLDQYRCGSVVISKNCKIQAR